MIDKSATGRAYILGHFHSKQAAATQIKVATVSIKPRVVMRFARMLNAKTPKKMAPITFDCCKYFIFLENDEAWHPLPGAPLRFRLRFVATLRI
jgi:hypothetical protein